MTADDHWTRLGALLVRRRVELDRRFRNRSVFSRERDIEYHIVSDIERARRTNFEPQTIALLEHAYKLPMGAIDRVLAGGELEPAEPLIPEPGPDEDPDSAYIRSALPRLDRAQKAVLVGIVQSWLNPATPSPARARETA